MPRDAYDRPDLRIVPPSAAVVDREPRDDPPPDRSVGDAGEDPDVQLTNQLSGLAADAALTNPPDPNPEARAWAQRIYLQLRARVDYGSPSLALKELHHILKDKRERIPAFAPPPDADLIKMWFEEGEWESKYRQRRIDRVLEQEAASPAYKLAALLAAEEDAAVILAEATQPAQQPHADRDDLTRYRQALRSWTDLQALVSEAESEVRRRTYETSHQSGWKETYDRLYSQLMETYQAHGPQYEILVGQLARHEIRMQQLTSSGRDVPMGEYNEATRTIVALVNQLQRYTEATKSETVTREVNEAILQVLELVERLTAAEAPQLWLRIAREVQRLVTIDTPIPIPSQTIAAGE